MDKPSQRRLAENEVIFRLYNESVQQRIDAFNKEAAEQGAAPLEIRGEEPLYFYCECSDESCNKRIRITLNDYNRIHKARDMFTIICGHEIKEFEDVIAQEEGYCVAKKHAPPPQQVKRLNPTELDNA